MAEQSRTNTRAGIVYFSHGGGPLPILGDSGHKAMVDFMGALPDRIAKPEAILVVSAHWEERKATLLSGRTPSLFYDYYGFPDEAYSVRYPVPGDPEPAARIFRLFGEKGIPAHLDPERGFDHGLFIPLMLMYPEADIPALQLSLIEGLDPSAHIALGRAFDDLMNENILVIGSGFSFHNLREFFRADSKTPDPANDAFQDWLIDVCTGPLDRSERERLLIGWRDAPYAGYCHPREEHLMPLHVCLGMAGRPATKIFDDHIMGKRAVAFLW